jgi:hypothetical protein
MELSSGDDKRISLFVIFRIEGFVNGGTAVVAAFWKSRKSPHPALSRWERGKPSAWLRGRLRRNLPLNYTLFFPCARK